MTIPNNKSENNNSPFEPTRQETSKRYESVAEGIGTLRQYQDIPLHVQRQWVSTFFVALILIFTIASLYLNVASQIALTGREVQDLKHEINVNKRVNADMQTKIALLLSSTALRERAQQKGYVALESTDLEYITVPGYFPKPAAIMAASSHQVENSYMQPEYSETLFSWLARQLETASMPLAKEH